MILRWREFSGRPGKLLMEKLHRSIARYQEESESIGLGLTTDPTRWWSQQRWAGWDEMVVIYSTSSRDFASTVESELRTLGWSDYYTSWNYNSGQEGIPGSYTRYYVYVVRG